LERGEGVVFVNEAPPAEFPRDFVRPTEMGVRETLEKGVIAGYPVTDVRVTLTGGRYHEVDSATMDFQIAGSMAARQVMHRASPGLLEPIMHISIMLAEEHVGNVVGDLSRRRGTVTMMAVRGLSRMIDGEVPLSEARGYATTLRSLTQGRGTFTLELDRYDQVPDSIADEIIKQRRADGKVPIR
jgi:elongation factor G